MRRRKILAASFGLLVCLISTAGCDSGSSDSATTRPAAGEAIEAPERPPAVIPPPHATAPSTTTASENQHDPNAGREIYELVCAICHGKAGNNEGVMTEQFMVTPVRHDNGAYMNQLSNDYLFKIISEGGTAVGKSPQMKPWREVYSPDQIWSVVAYLRTLAEPPFGGPTP